jgi:transcriptional regulator with XRE-family HTH domain
MRQRKQMPWPQRVRRARTDLPAFLGLEKWTQEDLGKAMAVTANTIARWERGEVEGTVQASRMLAYCYHLAMAGLDVRTLTDTD